MWVNPAPVAPLPYDATPEQVAQHERDWQRHDRQMNHGFIAVIIMAILLCLGFGLLINVYLMTLG